MKNIIRSTILFLFIVNTSGKFTLLWTNNSREFEKVISYISNEWYLKDFFTKRIVDNSDPLSLQRQLCEIAKTNEIPIVGLLDFQTRLIIDSYTKVLNIPFITWGGLQEMPPEFIQKKEPCQIFSVQPDLTNALINYLIEWKWHHFIYIYRTDYSFYRMNKVLHNLYSRELLEEHLDIIPVFLPNNEKSMFNNLRILDRQISRYPERKIVIDMHERVEIEELLRCLKLLGMLRQEYHYLMVNFRIMQLPLSSYKSSRVNITGFHILNYLNQETRGFITQWTRLLGDEELSSVSFMLDTFLVLQSILNNNRFRYPSLIKVNVKCKNFYNLTKLKNERNYKNNAELLTYLKSINTVGQTGPILFDNKTCIRSNVTILLTKFNGQGGGEMIAATNPDQTWNILVGSEKSKEDADNKINNHSFVIRVVTILANPFVMYRQNVVGEPQVGKQYFEGYCIDLAREIFTMINRSYEIHLVRDNTYGAYSRVNGTWNGIVGELVRGEADVAIAPLTVSSSRAKSIIFTEPFMTFGLSLIMKKPVETKPGFFSFMKPLSNDVWIGTASACLLIAIGLRIISRISPFEWDREVSFNMGNSIWFTFAAVVRQGAEIFPKSPGGRILASIWWMFSLVHIAYYTANLAAFLSVANLISPISKIHDLVEKKELGIKVGTLNSGSTKEYFESSTMYPFTKVYEMLKNDPTLLTKTIDEGVSRVRKEGGKYVFILESKMNEFKNNRLPCDTIMVGSPFGSKAYAVATRAKDGVILEIKEQITDAILQLREKQTLADLYTTWWIKKGECLVESEGSNSKPLALANLSGVFYILFFGILLSLLIGVITFIYNVRKLKYKLKQSPGVSNEIRQ